MICPCSDNDVTVKKNETHLYVLVWKNSKLNLKKKKKITLENSLALFTRVGGMHTRWANDFPSRDMYICIHVHIHPTETHTGTQDIHKNVLNSITHNNPKLETIQMRSTAEQMNWELVIRWNAEQQWKRATVMHNMDKSYIMLHVNSQM